MKFLTLVLVVSTFSFSLFSSKAPSAYPNKVYQEAKDNNLFYVTQLTTHRWLACGKRNQPPALPVCFYSDSEAGQDILTHPYNYYALQTAFALQEEEEFRKMDKWVSARLGRDILKEIFPED